jgi:hypothetical protein
VAGRPVTLPPVPPGGERLWSIFADLSAARAEGMSGPQPIGWRDIADWSELTGHRLARWELEAIRHLDGVALEAWREVQPKPKEGGRG